MKNHMIRDFGWKKGVMEDKLFKMFRFGAVLAAARLQRDIAKDIAKCIAKDIAKEMARDAAIDIAKDMRHPR